MRGRRPRGLEDEIELGAKLREGAAVLGARPEFVRRDARGPFAGRVVLDAFHGACRYLHVEGPFGRLVARTSASSASAAGEEARFSFEPAGLRLFDSASGRRIA